MEFAELGIDPKGTHHLSEGVPIYDRRFDAVGPFCFPGLAAVRDASGAYHINFLGEPAYEGRFEWTGNFSEGVAAVRTADDRYHHIDENGNPITFDTYLYATNFSKGSAVVYHETFGATHITTAGEQVYGDWYFDARPFSAGSAAVRDETGWLLIDASGVPLSRTTKPAGTFPIQGNVRFVPPESPIPEILKTAEWGAAAVLMRHGERQPFIKGEPGSTKVLTARGRRQSRAFGSALPRVTVRAYASPMTRCVQTGNEVLAGAQSCGTTEKSLILGTPSAYVADDELVREFYVVNPVKIMSLRYASGETLPGHYPVADGTRRMLDYVLGTLADGEISVCITHDAWIVPFVSLLAGYDFTNDWPTFLDGCILMRRGRDLYLWWRGTEYEIERRCNESEKTQSDG